MRFFYVRWMWKGIWLQYCLYLGFQTYWELGMNENAVNQESQDDFNNPPGVYKIKCYKPDTLLSRLSYALIRPPRLMYNEDLLDPQERYQDLYKVQHHLIPFKLTLYTTDKMKYVLLYLHGNSSSRLEGYIHLRDLPPRVGLACFDFNGCGMRFDSRYISLGVNQSKDVDIAARFLKKLGYQVVGWGRSMGSVSLLLSSEIDVLVADSPFASLTDLCKQYSSSMAPLVCRCLVNCFFPCLFSCVKQDVQRKAGFDVGILEIAKKVAEQPRNKERALFLMAGVDDSLIKYHHSQRIYEVFPGVKQLQLFNGSHNSKRPIEIIRKAFNFISEQLNPTKSRIQKKLKPLQMQAKKLCREITQLKQPYQLPRIHLQPQQKYKNRAVFQMYDNKIRNYYQDQNDEEVQDRRNSQKTRDGENGNSCEWEHPIRETHTLQGIQLHHQERTSGILQSLKRKSNNQREISMQVLKASERMGQDEKQLNQKCIHYSLLEQTNQNISKCNLKPSALKHLHSPEPQ